MSDKLKLSDEIRRGDYEDFHLFILADKVLALESENDQLQKLKDFLEDINENEMLRIEIHEAIDELLNQSNG